jgi:hypothetical protein
MLASPWVSRASHLFKTQPLPRGLLYQVSELQAVKQRPSEMGYFALVELAAGQGNDRWASPAQLGADGAK